ncbi:MAG: hypothetical protein PHD53_00145 [Methylococcales bacterium]|nr:hypothetical protein [Methylococcales bacterium]
MPEIDFDFQYIIKWFHELGICENNGMGTTPFSHKELHSWRENMQLDVLPWDISLLREMSVAFISMQEKSKDPEQIDPLLDFE